MPGLSNRVQTFTDSVIRRMTRISDEYGAINLSQGFPDFDPPKEIMDALAKAAYEGPHQYSITFGAENFREALARKQERAIGRTIDPDKEIVVTCGGTEAMMCAMMTICNPGDKVMVFSPFYENYGADAILSGADPIYIPLVPPEYHFDMSLVEKGFLTTISSSFSMALTQSGMILSSAKSPPPITFPARAVDIATSDSLKKEFL